MTTATATAATYQRGQRIRLAATFGINPTFLAARALAGALTLTTRAVTGYVGADIVVLSPGTDVEEAVTVASVSGLVVTLSAVTKYDHALGSAVWELADPGTLSLQVQNPAGLETTYTYALSEVTRNSLGKFYKDFDIPDTVAATGRWVFRWKGSSTVLTAGEREFRVAASQF